MKGVAFFVVVLLVSGASDAQNVLAWDSAAKLTWADFQGKVDVASSFSASTVSGINYKFQLNSDGYSDSIVAVFYRAESWVRFRNDDGLAHEQGHFDITEIFARKLRKRIREFIPKRGSLSQQLKQLYDEVEADREATESLYDEETKHSADGERQAYWKEKIRDQLKELEEYGY